MSSLDERRSKRRRKSTSDDGTAAVGILPATPEAASSDEAKTGAPVEPVRRHAEKTPPVESINFAAYLRHAVTQAPDQRALACAQRG